MGGRGGCITGEQEDASMTRLDAKFAGAVTAVMIVIAPYSVRADDLHPDYPEDTEDTDGSSAADCPDALRGSTVSARSIRNGVSLEFSTASKALVPGLRGHVRDLEAFLSEHTELASNPATGTSTRIKVAFSNTTTGARVTLEAEKPADIIDLRALGEQFEEAWKMSACGPETSMPSSGRDLQT